MEIALKWSSQTEGEREREREREGFDMRSMTAWERAIDGRTSASGSTRRLFTADIFRWNTVVGRSLGLTL